jgi:hypothetical protein
MTMRVLQVLHPLALPFTPDVRPLYDLLEVVLLPSRSEGLSQSLLEAMRSENRSSRPRRRETSTR